MLNKDRLTALKIAEEVNKLGGTAYFVGGFVRDRLRGVENKDMDIEVHGISADALRELLEGIGCLLVFGESFGIFSLKGYNIDIALPRKDKATGGGGHKDFTVDADPDIGAYKAASRRDFTVNALMQNILTGEITDFFGGRDDINKKILRHVNALTFPEDPLRTLRLARFAACLGFTPAKETKELCKRIDLSRLSKERVFEEMKKALLNAKKPSVFFETLRETDALKFWFPELKALPELPRNKNYPLEKRIRPPALSALDIAAEYTDCVSYPLGFMLTALCLNFEKTACAYENDGKNVSYKHKNEEMSAVRKFIERFTEEKKLMKYVLNMLSLYRLANSLADKKAGIPETNRLFDSASVPEDLIYFSSRAAFWKKPENESFLFERLKIYRDIMAKPYVKGADLIAAGMPANAGFSRILRFAHTLRLAGVEKESALKQTVRFAERENRERETGK